MGKDGATSVQPRHVAVAIPWRYRDGAGAVDAQGGQREVEICLVTSRKHDGQYVLPKGGVEHGETSLQAAVREMWEEAGLRPASSNAHQTQAAASTPLGSDTIADHKPHKHSPSTDPNSAGFVPRAIYTAHEIEIDADGTQSGAEWPESAERQRAWFALAEAQRQIAWRKDIAELLRRSSLARRRAEDEM